MKRNVSYIWLVNHRYEYAITISLNTQLLQIIYFVNVVWLFLIKSFRDLVTIFILMIYFILGIIILLILKIRVKIYFHIEFDNWEVCNPSERRASWKLILNKLQKIYQLWLEFQKKWNLERYRYWSWIFFSNNLVQDTYFVLGHR